VTAVLGRGGGQARERGAAASAGGGRGRRVWRGAHGGGRSPGRRGGGPRRGGGARRGADAAGARRATETSERRGRRKEKACMPFISPLCRVPAIWHSAKIFF
jgi:protein Tex